MCIAILTKKGHVLKRDHFYNSFENNSDGIGIMYAKNNRLEIYKTMKDVDAAYMYYLTIAGMYDIALHFRISTSGGVNMDNCHPFFINDDVALMHNGIITNIKTDENENDTRAYIRTKLKLLKKKFYLDEICVTAIEKEISGSKFIIMDNKGEWKIFNEAGGYWKEGIWYSNLSYACKRYYAAWDDDYDWRGYNSTYFKNYKNYGTATNHKPKKKYPEVTGGKDWDLANEDEYICPECKQELYYRDFINYFCTSCGCDIYDYYHGNNKPMIDYKPELHNEKESDNIKEAASEFVTKEEVSETELNENEYPIY